MKKLLIPTLLFVSSFYAQITKNVGDFSKVTSFDKIEVYLNQSTENKVTVSGNDAESVQFVNNNGELKIRMPLDKILSGENISVKVFYKKITAIEANEGSRIASENTIKATAFNIIAKEGAIIKIDLETKALSSKISSGAVLEVEGSANNHESIVNAGGVLNARNFKTLQTTVTSNAGGEAEVNAADYVDAKVRAGGTILIFGKPKQIDQKTILGGSISEN
jgi:hypothetical protein